MKRRFSTLLLSALAVVAVGGLTLLRTGLTAEAARQDWTPLVTKNYPVTGTFTDISITGYYEDIYLRPSRDGTVSVTTRDAESVTHTVSVANGVLSISRPEPDSTGDRLFFHDSDPELILYLPAGDYGALSVSTMSGDVQTASRLAFSAANFTTISGDVELYSSVSGNIVCNTTSGDIELRCPTAGAVQVVTTSGDVELNDSYVQSLSVESTSGDVDLERSTAAGAVEISTVSGEISLERSDAASLTLSTTSGEIEGSLLSAKNFSVTSTHGRVQVPDSDPTAGACTISTTTGNVWITIRP